MDGPHKLLLPFHGRPLIHLPVEAAIGAGLDPIGVVVGSEADAIRNSLADLPAVVIENPDFASGLSSSVASGVAWAAAHAEAVLIMLGDEPGVSADVIRRAVHVWGEINAPAARVRYADRPGHPVILRLPLGSTASTGGDRGLVSLFARGSGAHEIAVPQNAPIDVDTEGDYRQALARLPH